MERSGVTGDRGITANPKTTVMRKATIGIIIPVHNRVGHTVACIDSISRSTYQGFRVYVVDDGSTDGTASILAERHPHVKVVRGDGSLWWTKATNLGIRQALDDGVEHVLLLNNDNLLSRETLGELLRVSHDRGGAIVGSVVVVKDDGGWRVKHACLASGVDRGIKARNPYYNRYLEDLPEIMTTEILSGQGSLIPRWVFDKTGFFDSVHFPQYMADFDFFMRCRRKGIPMFVARNAIVEDDPTSTGIHMSFERVPSFRGFARSLIAINSHRNVRANVAYFRRYSKDAVRCLFGLAIFYAGYLTSFFLAKLGMRRVRFFLINHFR